MAVDNGMVTAPQLQYLTALADKLAVSEEERKNLTKLTKEAADALIRQWKSEVRESAVAQ